MRYKTWNQKGHSSQKSKKVKKMYVSSKLIYKMSNTTYTQLIILGGKVLYTDPNMYICK